MITPPETEVDRGPITATVRPETVEDLEAVVARLVAEGQAIYPRGGGCSLNYGGSPTLPGTAVDTTALSQVVDYPAADMTITVEAGITLAALQATLAEHGQRLQVDPPQADRATLGGVFATRSTGPRRFGLGGPRDQVLGVRFVAASGLEIKGGGRVVKNVAGYDLPKLLTGSMGTLGVIAELTMKVRPLPESTALAISSPPDAAALDQALTILNTSKTRPVAVELLNAKAARALGGAVADGTGPWRLLIGYEASGQSIEWQLGALKTELTGHLRMFRDAESTPIWKGLEELPAAALGDVSIVASTRASAVPRLAATLDESGWTVHAHAASGIVRAQKAAGPSDLDAIATEVARLRASASIAGGSLVVARCLRPWKPILRVWGDPRPDWPLMARLKAALDPLGLMNPGRFDPRS